MENYRSHMRFSVFKGRDLFIDLLDLLKTHVSKYYCYNKDVREIFIDKGHDKNSKKFTG